MIDVEIVQYFHAFIFQTKMQTLNEIVWPEIAKLATEEVRKFGAGENYGIFFQVSLSW